MKVLIIEDELASSRRLERMLFNLNIEVIGCLNSVSLAVKWLKENDHPNIIFLDINLSDNLSFEIFNQVDVRSPIIFTTAYSEYSIKAFDYYSIAYLLKPINEAKLKNAIDKSQRYNHHNPTNEIFKNIKQLASVKNYKEDFTVKSGSKIKIINIKDIECFYSAENLTFIFSNNINYCINYSLSQLEKLLHSNYFFRVNRSIIINKKFIKDISKHYNSRLKINMLSYLESEIITSRERTKSFKEWLKQ